MQHSLILTILETEWKIESTLLVGEYLHVAYLLRPISRILGLLSEGTEGSGNGSWSASSSVPYPNFLENEPATCWL